MRKNLFAYTPTTSSTGHTVPYASLNVEDDGRVTLTVRSGGPAGHCAACGSQEPHSATIELGEEQLDQLASALASRPSFVRRMVNRFLGWRLPASFCPDAGISFNPTDLQKSGVHPWPVGTNLMTAEQSREMLAELVRP